MTQVRILIADDNTELCDGFRVWLSGEPWVIETVYDGRDALDRLRRRHFDIAVLDLEMPHLSGLEVLQAMKKEEMNTEVLVMSGYGTIHLAVEAMKLGARDFLTKPIAVADFIQGVRRMLGPRHRTSRNLAEQIDEFLHRQAGQPDLRVDAVADRFGISARYVSKLLRENKGGSFRDQLVYHRVQKAKKLLVTTEFRMFQIAEACGFRNQRRFSEAFRRLERVSPRAFRQASSGPGR